jgi:hypothetical protein
MTTEPSACPETLADWRRYLIEHRADFDRDLAVAAKLIAAGNTEALARHASRNASARAWRAMQLAGLS